MIEPVALPAPADRGVPIAGAGSEPVVIELGELLPDEHGEVVLFPYDDLAVRITTSEVLTQSGIIDSHVTAAGVPVDGLHYYSFGNGVTLYSPLDVLIADPTDVG